MLGRTLGFVVLGVLLSVALAWAEDVPSASDEVFYEGRNAAEWMVELKSDDYQASSKASAALKQIGAPAVPALLETINNNGKPAYQACEVLSGMGPQAAAAVPRLVEIAGDKNWPAAELTSGQSQSIRHRVIYMLGRMPWAATQTLSVLMRCAEDEKESEEIRVAAVHSLGGLEGPGDEYLRKVADGAPSKIRESARSALGESLQKRGVKTREEYYRDLIGKDPFDPYVPGYLSSSKGRIGAGNPDELTQQIKQMYRARLARDPDPRLAWSLAIIISNQLRNSHLGWAAPTDSYPGTSEREDAAENHDTLADVLELGWKNAGDDIEIKQQIGIGLAKLRLLQGDWDGMNSMLEATGQEPMRDKDKPWLAMPPSDWTKDLNKRWIRSSTEWNSGTCGMIVRVEKDGKGLKGFHVLVKNAPVRSDTWVSGIDVHTLLHSVSPLPMSTGPAKSHWIDEFGCPDKWYENRYGISDDSGEVRLDKLPKKPVTVEVLVPTNNFTEYNTSGWDLWLETAPGEFKRAAPYPGELKGFESPASFELKENETVRYPLLVVRPRFGLNALAWEKVIPEDFVLRWTKPDVAEEGEVASYNLDMTLSGPGGFGLTFPAIKSASASNLTVTEWPIGKEGVGGLKLAPGNVYVLRVTALDAKGRTLAVSPETPIWIPWTHRAASRIESKANAHRLPFHISNGSRDRSTISFADSEIDRLEAFIKNDADTFEWEYARLARVRYDLDKGNRERAENELNSLASTLPEGNVVHDSAVSALERLKKDGRLGYGMFLTTTLGEKKEEAVADH